MVSSPQAHPALKQALIQWERSLTRFTQSPHRRRAIHDFRTATRRADEAVQLLGHHLPDLHELIRRLGPIRDLEAALERRLDRMSRARLSARLRARATTLQHTLKSAEIQRIPHQLQRIRARPATTEPLLEMKKLQRSLRRAGTLSLRTSAVKLHNLRRTIRRLRLASDLLAMPELSREAADWQGQLGRWRDALLLGQPKQERRLRKAFISRWNAMGGL